MISSLVSREQFTSFAPANVMLMGEHSVMQGNPALVATLPPTMKIHWQARADDIISIDSMLAQYQAPLDQLHDHPQLRFILAPLRRHAAELPQGFNLKVECGFPDNWGLGSSAAVLAACLMGVKHILRKDWSTWQLFQMGHQDIITVQGKGSGADLAACLNGGLVYFHPNQHKIKRIEASFKLCLVYCGYKTPTAKVLSWVEKKWQTRLNDLHKLYKDMAKVTERAHQALRHHDTAMFFEAVTDYQLAMEHLGVVDETLAEIIDLLHTKGISAKVSGSGLGDCAVGFEHLNSPPGYPYYNTQISPQAAGISA